MGIMFLELAVSGLFNLDFFIPDTNVRLIAIILFLLNSGFKRGHILLMPNFKVLCIGCDLCHFFLQFGNFLLVELFLRGKFLMFSQPFIFKLFFMAFMFLAQMDQVLFLFVYLRFDFVLEFKHTVLMALFNLLLVVFRFFFIFLKEMELVPQQSVNNYYKIGKIIF